MSRLKVFLDTNVLVDFLHQREPFFERARLLMTVGRLGELDLWMSASQVTDLVFILSDGGKASLMDEVLRQLRGLRTFVRVCPVDSSAIDQMLATTWADPEDALLFDLALSVRADALVTRNRRDFESDLIKVTDCDGLFAWLRDDFEIDYETTCLEAEKEKAEPR
ncbi:MAG: PIN domain-containing protein [Eggerthellaceae bacterium]|nr:PIN domain-containing protein [Eggerthellaceae bacterium]